MSLPTNAVISFPTAHGRSSCRAIRTGCSPNSTNAGVECRGLVCLSPMCDCDRRDSIATHSRQVTKGGSVPIDSCYAECQNPNVESSEDVRRTNSRNPRRIPPIRISVFGFPSTFGFRHSTFSQQGVRSIFRQRCRACKAMSTCRKTDQTPRHDHPFGEPQ
jgi:hypothetical protein